MLFHPDKNNRNDNIADLFFKPICTGNLKRHRHSICRLTDMTTVAGAVLFHSESKCSGLHANERP